MNRLAGLVLPLALVAISACSDSKNPVDSGIPKGDPVLGRLAFEESCSGCHASKDAFDIKTFGFMDTTIIRRAVKHVDTATARNIVAYISNIAAPRIDEKEQLFQPKAVTLSSDVDFATALFGRDAWPSDLTTNALLAIDPRKVAVSIRIPIWSDEVSNKDWMPDFELPSSILNYSNGAAATAIANYRASPTRENLSRAVTALRNADRATANPSAPCLVDDPTRVKYRECFEVRRWTSTLVALHMLRSGSDANLGSQLHDIWWDVGNVARRSRADATNPIANSLENWAAWMYLGWSFDPSLHSSSYTAGAFNQLKLSRQATFIALRTEIARPKGSASVYEDYVNAVRFAPTSWTLPVATFALRHISERLASGDRPSLSSIANAITQIYSGLTEANKKLAVPDQSKVQTLALQVIAALGQ
jgi:hypothetical protein